MDLLAMRYLKSVLGGSFRQNRGLVLLGMSMACGCSLALDAGRPQCSSNKDCTDRGTAFAGSICINALCQPEPRWACVDSATEPEPQAAISAGLEVRNLLSGEPMPGVRASLFTQFDFQLSQPLASGTSGADGRMTLTVPAGFQGFISLEETGVIEPTLVYPNLPVTAAEGFGTVLAGSAGQSVGLVSMLHGTPIADRGLLLVQVLDCMQNGAQGGTVAFQGDLEGSIVFYTVGGVASEAATALDETGNAGIVNLKEGLTSVEAMVNGKSVSSGSALVRPDSATWVTLLPGRRARQWN